MASYNRVILMGNLTRDPELKTLPSQTVVCDFALAVNRRWKDTDGADREEVLFIDCAAFGKTGQTIGESLTKGRPIHIEGRSANSSSGSRRTASGAARFAWSSSSSGLWTESRSSSQPAQRNGRGKRRSNGKTSRPARQPGELVGTGVGADKDIPI